MSGERDDAARDGTARQPILFLIAVVAAAVGLWRAAVGTGHMIAARKIAGDPSMRELEQASAMFEGAAAVIALVHAAAAVSMARSGVRIESPLMLSLAAYCCVVIAAALMGVPLLAYPGAFPLAIVLGAFTLGMLLPFTGISVYLGVVAGGVAGYALGVPQGDVVGCVFVVVPCVLYAYGGAWLGRRFSRRARRAGANDD